MLHSLLNSNIWNRCGLRRRKLEITVRWAVVARLCLFIPLHPLSFAVKVVYWRKSFADQGGQSTSSAEGVVFAIGGRANEG